MQIVDEFTGRILHGRRYSEGLHQAIEAKESIRSPSATARWPPSPSRTTSACTGSWPGMTGTAETEATEFTKIYDLDVVVIPTNRPVGPGGRRRPDLPQRGGEARRPSATRSPSCTQTGQPVLVGTISIEKSEKLSRLLTGRGVRHEVLNAKNHAREALIIAEAGRAGRGDHRHQHGRPRHRHQAGRQPGVPRPAQAGDQAPRRTTAPRWPRSSPPGRRTTRR